MVRFVKENGIGDVLSIGAKRRRKIALLDAAENWFV